MNRLLRRGDPLSSADYRDIPESRPQAQVGCLRGLALIGSGPKQEEGYVVQLEPSGTRAARRCEESQLVSDEHGKARDAYRVPRIYRVTMNNCCTCRRKAVATIAHAAYQAEVRDVEERECEVQVERLRK